MFQEHAPQATCPTLAKEACRSSKSTLAFSPRHFCIPMFWINRTQAFDANRRKKQSKAKQRKLYKRCFFVTHQFNFPASASLGWTTPARLTRKEWPRSKKNRCRYLAKIWLENVVFMSWQLGRYNTLLDDNGLEKGTDGLWQTFFWPMKNHSVLPNEKLVHSQLQHAATDIWMQ